MKHLPEIFSTKVTRIKPGVWGCRVMDIATQKPIVELRVNSRLDIGNAFFDMLRTLDKLGYMSPMAHATRQRQKAICVNAKYIWFKKRI